MQFERALIKSKTRESFTTYDKRELVFCNKYTSRIITLPGANPAVY